MKVLPIKITESTYRAMRDDLGGYCTNCGAERYEIEPDARKYPCDVCGANACYGVEGLMLMGLIDVVDEEDES